MSLFFDRGIARAINATERREMDELELQLGKNLLTTQGGVTIAKVNMMSLSFWFQLGNNLLTTQGAIAIVKAINDTESSEMEELDLTVRSHFTDILQMI